MAFLRCYGNDLTQKSTWEVSGGSPVVISAGPTTVEGYITVNYSGIPVGSTISSAIMYRSNTSPNTGFATRTIDALTRKLFDNGISIDGVNPGGTRSYLVRFKANGSTSGGPGTHSGSVTWSNVYVDVTYTEPYSGATSPSSASVAPSVVEGTNPTITYAGAAGGTNNGISAIQYRYADSTDGVNWGAWSSEANSGLSSASGGFNVAANGTWGSYRKYQLRTMGAAGADWAGSWVNVSGTVRQKPATAATSPSSASVSPAVSEGDATVTYSGASGGDRNSISAIQYRYRESSDNSTWGEWSSAVNGGVSAIDGELSVPPHGTREHFRQYQLRTMGAAGADWAGSWVDVVGSVQRQPATAITGPTATSLSKAATAYTVDLAYSGISPGYGNDISGINIQYKDSSDNGVTWSADWAALTTKVISSASGTVQVLGPSVNGYLRRYRLMVVGTGGESLYGPFVEVPGTVEYVAPPSAPIFIAPSAFSAESTFNLYPRVLVELGPLGESGLLQKLLLLSSGYITTPLDFASAGTKIRMVRGSSMAVGSETISVKAENSKGSISLESSSTVRRAVIAFTDPVLTKGITEIRAIHIIELQTAISRIQRYYGIPQTTTWHREIVPGTTGLYEWKEDIESLRTAVEGIVSYVNEWVPGSEVGKIILPAWIALTRVPKTEVIDQMRSVLLLL